ncbi:MULTISPECIES: SulP family inorganic anion transporter [Rhodococcus]|uniref:Sulfate transporter n=1 Tax=Rhodococcus pyridinivorans AK37 TaxID=1114960 RepID=H0JY06_9NOCA|nr:SulP family inorganic anion transporter [Rhodococcus pyridinivorans]EHK80644.1 sulfate transporter [Rhodococcus pyridinivorans AK37]MCD2117015.1 SulP family inorganic anion transporter [Rhodococcus pyridinivorans]MCD2139385.1 SulP family inorganic anion transporter [Rhodococcus pyridinivorans]MCZ4626143.1 SulP family inorganic anion transporter [Rhodococcus pyridinivorans]MCZ4647091.1 SulP family inorganic anion transporter [Rhodococcus pyridinivorans]
MWLLAAFGRLPGVATARSYRRGWLRGDVTAGLALSALLVPTGMGYAQAAGLPPYTGLYATVVPMLVYAVVGPSRILVLGPDSALAPLIAAAVIPLAADGDPQRAVALAGVLALLVGAILLVGGILRFGFLTYLLSTPIRVGFLNAIAIIVIVGQLPLLLGTSADESGVVAEVLDVVDDVFEDGVEPVGLLLGAGTLAVILVLQKVVPRIPAVLVAVVAASAAVEVFGLTDRVEMVGALPSGIPAPVLGGIERGDVIELLAPAVAVAVIAFADTAVLSRSFALRRGEDVDGSSEMRALGVVNIAAGATGGFPICGSGSRTPVLEQAGARTQLAGAVGAVTVAIFLLAAPGATAYLPQAALAAVVIAAASALVDAKGLGRLWRVNKIEFCLSFAAFVAVGLAGVLRGVLVAIALSLAVVIVRAWQPHRTELVELENIAGYHDRERHPEGHRIPGLVLVRFDAPLFFANGVILTKFVRELVREREDRIEWVVLAAEPITDLDISAVEELERLDDYLAHRGIRLAFAAMKGPVKDKLHRMQSGNRFGAGRFHPTVRTAVVAFRHRNQPGIERSVLDAPPQDIVPPPRKDRPAPP